MSYANAATPLGAPPKKHFALNKQDEPAVNQLPQRETEQRKRNVPTKDMTKLYINEELEKEDEEVSVPELIEIEKKSRKVVKPQKFIKAKLPQAETSLWSKMFEYCFGF